MKNESIDREMEFLATKRVLDIGCGAGIFSEGLAKQGFTVTGIDPTQKCIDLAQEHLRNTGSLDLQGRITYHNTSLETFQEEQKASDFDIVCCSEVVEHVENAPQFVETIKQSLKSDKPQYLFMSTIAKTPESYLSNIILGEKVLGIVPDNTHEWEKFINFEDLKAMIEKDSDLKVFASAGATVCNPKTMEMAEIAYLRQNYMLMAKRL